MYLGTVSGSLNGKKPMDDLTRCDYVNLALGEIKPGFRRLSTAKVHLSHADTEDTTDRRPADAESGIDTVLGDVAVAIRGLELFCACAATVDGIKRAMAAGTEVGHH
jgi:hypothetical protein